MPNSSLRSFFDPYLQFLRGAAYSLHQVLEGLGITSSSFTEVDSAGKIVDSYWSAEQGVYPVLGALIVLTILLIPFVSLAAYTINRTKGLVIFYVLLCLPGLLNLAGLYPNILYMPQNYNINGTGTLGSEIGMIPLLLIAVVTGWAGIILVYDNLRLTERFRQYYDHLWFPTALVAAYFFVADNGAHQNTSKLNEIESSTQQSSRYLLGQVRKYQDYCKANGMINSKSCQWSDYVQWQLSNTSESTAPLFVQLAPDTSAEYYSKPGHKISSQDIIDIRNEISNYNQTLCPVKTISKDIKQMAPLSSTCEAPPTKYCLAFPDGPEGIVDRYIITQPVALASECIIPTLVASKPRLTKLFHEFEKNERAKNYRWLYFLVIAVAVGGKVANSSTKLAEFDTRPPEKRRIILKVFAKYLTRSLRLVRLIVRIVIHALAYIYKFVLGGLSKTKRVKKLSNTNNS